MTLSSNFICFFLMLIKYLMFSICIHSITFLIKYDKCQWKINVQKKIKVIQNLPLRNNLCQYFEKYHVRPLFKHIYTCELCKYGVTLIILCQMVFLNMFFLSTICCGHSFYLSQCGSISSFSLPYCSH